MGHSTFEDLDAGLISASGRRGNLAADGIADWGFDEFGPAALGLVDVFVARRGHLAALLRRVQWRVLR
eukprot:604250-Lingulodinium_polyedra.AAC.1